jgi:carbon-monoxide dehydrogenase catalytic subunit
MVVDIQCIMQNLANVAKCFHTHLITTHPIAKMEQENVIHIEFNELYALEDAKRIVKMAIDNFENRSADVMIPHYKATQIAGFGVESIKYHLGGTFRGTYYTLNDNIINGRIRGIAGVVGCNNARSRHNEMHIKVIKELLKNDVIVLTTGCDGITAAIHGLLTPEAGQVYCGPGLAEICETVGIPPVLHLGSCVDNSRILLAATEVVKAGGLGDSIADLPAAGSAPEWMSEKAISIGQYFVTSGVYTVFGGTFPTSGAPVFHNYISKELESIYGGMWDLKTDPIEHAWAMINHIDKKRKALGIDKARERVMMDMASRQALEG